MFITLLRILLIWWLISAVIKWISHMISSKKEHETFTGKTKETETFSGAHYSGEIEDAEFEEIDDQ